MRPLTAEDEATLRGIAERHSYFAARGPHTGEGSASRLIDALLAGEVVTLALTPADRRRLVAWLDEAPLPEGRLATVLQSVVAQLRPTLPKGAKAAAPRAPTVQATTPPTARRRCLTTDEAARRLDLSPARVQELARAGEIGRKIDGRWTFTDREIARVKAERDRHALRLTSARQHRARALSPPRRSALPWLLGASQYFGATTSSSAVKALIIVESTVLTSSGPSPRTTPSSHCRSWSPASRCRGDSPGSTHAAGWARN